MEINHQISPQYITKNKITVTVLDVVDPAHFVVKESPDLLNASPEAKSFSEAEEAMNKFYASVEPCFFQLPLKDSIIVSFYKKKFYRAKVIRILTQSAGHLFKIYLVDYGIECSVTRDCIYEIEKDFLVHPFQAVNFKLLGMEPVSMIMNPTDLTMSYGPVSNWDPSSEIFVHDLIKGKSNAYIEVQGIEGGNIYGKLYVTYENRTTKCVNDELISNSFAYFNEDCWEKIKKLESIGETSKKCDNSYTDSISESSNPEQMASPSNNLKVEPEEFGNFKVMFLRPSDNAVVAQSSLTAEADTNQELSLEQDIESKSQVSSIESDDTVFESSESLSSQKVPQSKENKSPESEAQLILEKRLQKLQQLNKKRHKSPMQPSSPNNLPSSTDTSFTTVLADKDVTKKTENSVGYSTSRDIPDNKDFVCKSDILNDSDSNKSSNDLQKLNSKDSPQLSPKLSLGTENENLTQDQLIAQKRFLKLQQRKKRHSKSFTCENMNGSSLVENLSTVTIGDINKDYSANSLNFVNGGTSVASIVERKENITEPNFSNHENEIASSIPSVEDSENSYRGIKESSNILNGTGISTPANNLRNERKSEELLENVKTLEKLRNKIKSKRLRNSLEAPTNSENGVNHSFNSLSDDSFSTSSHSKNSSSSLSPSKCSNMNVVSMAQITGMESSCFGKTNVVINNCENSYTQSRDLRKSMSSCSEKDDANIKYKDYANGVSAFVTKFMDTSSPIPKADIFLKNSVDQEIKESPIKKETVFPKNAPKLSMLNDSENSSLNNDSEGFKVLSQLIIESDSDDLLCTKSVKNASNEIQVEESFIKTSLQLQSSEIKNMYSSKNYLLEKQNMTVLPIGNEIPSPLLDIDKMNFSEHLKKVLKALNILKPFSIQSLVWPAIDNNRSVILISPPCSGKTVSYVLPLVSYLTTKDYSLTKEEGPVAITLCSSWIKAQSIADCFKRFLQGKGRIFTLCTDSSNYKQLNKVLYGINRCDILIATPFCLLQFLKKNLISLSQLKNFIIDCGTTIIDKNKKELKNILLSVMNSTKRKCSIPQMILCAERWNKNFQIIQKKLMLNPLLYFTSFLDFAMYAELSISAHVYESSEKKTALLDILQEPRKIVVCNSNAEDAIKLHHFLRYEDIRSFLITEEMEDSIAKGVIKDWQSARCMTSSHCLIITDLAVNKMHVSNMDCLIHYDIPQEFPLQFENRFACFAEHLKKMEGISECACHIFMTESDWSYASQVINIMKNSGVEPSQKLMDLCKRKYQGELPSDPLCHYIKAFGSCQDIFCKYRHYIDATEDKPQLVPCEGDIQALVTHVFNASHYIVKLLKYLDPVTNKTVSLVAAHANVAFQLRDFYKDEIVKEELIVKSPVVSESYVLEENEVFYRIKVLKCLSTSSNKLPKWEILYLDDGWVKEDNLFKLYKSTDQINLLHPLAIEIYACNISTMDSSSNWNPQTTDLVKKSISGKEIHGKIVLCLGKTLWLDPIVLRVKLSNENEYVNVFKLSQRLFNDGHARRNEDHLLSLKQLCEGKITLPRLTKPIVKEVVPEPEPLTNYAFLDSDVLEDVYVTSIVSPHQFYVQRAKFVDCLDKLFEKINTLAEKRLLKKANYLCKGMHCIAPFHEDNKYYRAVITDVSSSMEVQLFYVDFGDNGSAPRNNIYCIPPEFLLLPFQAIECELAGITAAHGGWTDSVANALFNLTRNEAGEMKILTLKVYSKRKGYEGGNHYVVDLWYNEKNISDELLQTGHGDPVDVSETFSSTVLCDEPKHDTDTSFELLDLDGNNSTSTDEGMHSEDKETATLFYGVLAKMVVEQNNLLSECSEITSQEDKILESLKTAHSSDSFDLSDTIKQNFPKLHNFIEKAASATQTVQSLKPCTTWWDTPENLHVVINLKDVKVYQLIVKDEEFCFNTIISGSQYSVEEKFYDKILSCEMKKFHNVEGINFTVPKCTPFKWPRLIKGKKKPLYIKYDLAHLDDSDTEKQSKTETKLKLPPPNYYSDDSSSTDYDEKYVEPWRDFVQNTSHDYFS